VQTQLPTKLDAQGRAYLPDNDSRVWAASKLVEAGKSEMFVATAPTVEGVYEYVCTFPGHWSIMRGKLVVTKDVAAYLKANPEP
jgi:azurin